MPTTYAMLYLHTLSPLHSGAGQGSGYIDLPISRSATTNWPEIPGSSVKGSLRTACTAAGVSDADVTAMFGVDIDTPGDGAGQLWPASARLLCYPVRSFKGTFAWVTCSLALRAWQRDYATISAPITLPIPTPASDMTIITSTSSRTPLSLKQGDFTRVLLEDLDLDINPDQPTQKQVDAIADRIADALFPKTESEDTEKVEKEWRAFFKARFAIVSDDAFTFFVTTATPVTAHIRINDDTKTVAKGALWYEETLPAETIFTLPLVDRPGDLLSKFSGGIVNAFQLGGNASVGQGVVRARIDPAPVAAPAEEGA